MENEPVKNKENPTESVVVEQSSKTESLNEDGIKKHNEFIEKSKKIENKLCFLVASLVISSGTFGTLIGRYSAVNELVQNDINAGLLAGAATALVLVSAKNLNELYKIVDDFFDFVKKNNEKIQKINEELKEIASGFEEITKSNPPNV